MPHPIRPPDPRKIAEARSVGAADPEQFLVAFDLALGDIERLEDTDARWLRLRRAGAATEIEAGYLEGVAAARRLSRRAVRR